MVTGLVVFILIFDYSQYIGIIFMYMNRKAYVIFYSNKCLL